jgi:hypothetical protein
VCYLLTARYDLDEAVSAFLLTPSSMGHLLPSWREPSKTSQLKHLKTLVETFSYRDVIVLRWTAKQEAFKKNVYEILVRKGVVKFEGFPLSDDRWRTYFIDLRLIPSVPRAFRRVEDV